MAGDAGPNVAIRRRDVEEPAKFYVGAASDTAEAATVTVSRLRLAPVRCIAVLERNRFFTAAVLAGVEQTRDSFR